VQLHFLRDEELEYRRSLFNAAASGDTHAQHELEREYRVWMFSKQRKTHSRLRTARRSGRTASLSFQSPYSS
jgi:hypothetical protein